VGKSKQDRAIARRLAALPQYSPEELKKKYPSWRYHLTAPPTLVHNPEEDADLGEGWADTPRAFQERAK
jgi:hypothetical protein